MGVKTEARTKGPERDAVPHPTSVLPSPDVKTLRGRVRTELETWGGVIGTTPRSGAYFILGALLIVLGFLLYIQFFLIGKMREEARAAAKQYAFFYRLAAANSIEDPKDFAFIFETLTKPKFPAIVTDTGGEILQNNIFAYGDTSEAAMDYLRRRVQEMDRHNAPVEVEISVSSLLREEDLKDPAGLAVRLREARDPVSYYLREHLSPDAQRLLDEYHGFGSPSGLLRYALIDGINHLLQGASLYDDQRFAQVALAEKTRILIRQGAQGEDLTRLNRMLLEDACPNEIAKRETPVGGKWMILVHYGDSDLIHRLSYLPFVALGVIALFVAVSYLGYRNIKNSEQRSIWVGMAKETAHQLGTPLSSLYGWLELMKAELTASEDVDSDKSARRLERAIAEMERDLGRLNKVVSRFSQIGSVPELRPGDLNTVIAETAAYLRARVPRLGKEIRIVEDYGQFHDIPINRELLGWAFENLMKNAVDAIEDREGIVRVVTRKWNEQFVEVLVNDNGKGIDPRHQRRIFEPGYSTKKRGWGLGLTLVKRIVEDYHQGRVTLLESALELGTTFQILLPIREWPSSLPLSHLWKRGGERSEPG